MKKILFILCGVIVIVCFNIFADINTFNKNNLIQLNDIEAQAKNEIIDGNSAELTTYYCDDNINQYTKCETSTDMFSSCYPGRDDSSCPAGTEEGDGLGGDPNCDHVFAMGRCVKCGLGLSGSDDKTESDVNKCPAGGYHNWTLYSKKIIRCSKCGTFENIY